MFKRNEEVPELESFVIYDSKSKTYGLPMIEKNSECIIRELATTFRKPEQQQNNHLYINAEDYSLFKNASYSKKTGLFESQPVEHIINLHDIRSQIPVAQQQKPDLGIVPT